MPLGEYVGYGFNSDVYVWSEDHIVKLLDKGLPADLLVREARNARVAHAKGLPVPAVGEQIDVDGRFGLVFERVCGPTMEQYMDGRPWTLLQSARIMARLHAEIHATQAEPGQRSQREMLQKDIGAASDRGLPAGLQDAAAEALGNMPDGTSMCHGDFTPRNIMMSARGPIVIDWLTATTGSPLADVAQTSLLLLFPPLDDIPWFINALIRWHNRCYLRRYLRLTHASERELSAWMSVVAAACFGEPWMQRWNSRLLTLIRNGLSLPETSTP